MLQWQIGDVSVTRVLELETPVPWDPEHAFLLEATPERLREMPWLFPHFVTPEGHLLLSIHALVVKAPGLTLVVDTCVGNDKPRELLGGQALQTAFLASLREAGCDPAAVDAVVCTHLHVDHVGWNTMLVDGEWVPTFPNARYLIGRREYAHWSADADPGQQAIMADSVQPIIDRGLAELVEMDHRICPEIRLLPTPGHTPGHVSVLIESRGERALITGDMLHHPCQFGHPEWSPPFDSDPLAGAAMRRSMMEQLAGEPVLVIGTHFAAPTAGHLQREGSAFRFEAG